MVFVSLNMRGGGMAPISLNVTSTGETSPARDPFTLNFKSLTEGNRVNQMNKFTAKGGKTNRLLASKKFNCSSADMAERTARSASDGV